jgi:hypothetical protein
MKNIRLLALFTFLLTFAWRITAAVEFSFSVVAQGTNSHFSSKTNVTGPVTTIVTAYSLRSTTFIIDNAALLKMLANSFNTEFPSNATLEVVDFPEKFYVRDGTNILLFAAPVLTIESTNVFIVSDSGVSTEIIATNQDLFHMRGGYKMTSLVTLKYDDTAQATRDGHTTSFSVTGIYTLQNAHSLGGKSPKFRFVMEFNGAGQGTFFNGLLATPFVMRGKFSNAFGSSNR